MTWTKLGAEFGSDPVLLALPRGVRLLHVEALVWSNAQGTDGHIPPHMLARLTDEPEPQVAAAQLVKAHKWRMSADGWEIVDFLNDQIRAEEVAKRNELNKIRTNRWRNHRDGLHHLCLPKHCDAARNAASDAASDGVRTVPSVPSRSDRNKGQGTDNGIAAALNERAAAVRENDPAPMPRRELGAMCRNEPDPAMRNRYRRMFDKSYGHLYPARSLHVVRGAAS